MRFIVTGARGTVGKVLVEYLAERGDQVVAWDRARVPIDDYHAMETFVDSAAADAILHLAVASRPTGRPNEAWIAGYHWPGELAWIARQHGIPIVYASTVMVFTDKAKGPFKPDSVPDATEGYGADKLRAEQRVREQAPDHARIVRLGWQLGSDFEGNQALATLEQWQRERGEVRASTRWLPACSFLPDTAAALVRAVKMPAGTYLLDSNERWNFFEVASALSRLHGNRWKVVPTEDFVYDQRMQDPRLGVPSLSTRLPSLAA